MPIILQNFGWAQELQQLTIQAHCNVEMGGIYQDSVVYNSVLVSAFIRYEQRLSRFEKDLGKSRYIYIL